MQNYSNGFGQQGLIEATKTVHVDLFKTGTNRNKDNKRQPEFFKWVCPTTSRGNQNCSYGLVPGTNKDNSRQPELFQWVCPARTNVGNQNYSYGFVQQRVELCGAWPTHFGGSGSFGPSTFIRAYCCPYSSAAQSGEIFRFGREVERPDKVMASTEGGSMFQNLMDCRTRRRPRDVLDAVHLHMLHKDGRNLRFQVTTAGGDTAKQNADEQHFHPDGGVKTEGSDDSFGQQDWHRKPEF